MIHKESDITEITSCTDDLQVKLKTWSQESKPGIQEVTCSPSTCMYGMSLIPSPHAGLLYIVYRCTATYTVALTPLRSHMVCICTEIEA